MSARAYKKFQRGQHAEMYSFSLNVDSQKQSENDSVDSDVQYLYALKRK